MDDIDKMDALLDLIQQDGWKLVENHIKSRIDDNKNRLLTCPLEDVNKHRARVEALQSVLFYISTTIESGKAALLKV